MRKILTNILFSIILLQFGCSVPAPSKEDFIGIWKSNDGGVFNFKDDNTFSAENLTGEKMFDGFQKYYGKKITEKGKWYIKKEKDRWRLFLDFKKVEQSNGGHSTQLNIEGKNGVLLNKPPWVLFVWIGDPDDINKYEFTK